MAKPDSTTLHENTECPRDRKPLFTRVAGSVYGHVIELWCVCGWSKPKLLAYPGMDHAVPPSPAEAWKPKPAQAGGYATAGKTRKGGNYRGPFARKNPREARREAGYMDNGALGPSMLREPIYRGPMSALGEQGEHGIVDPTS